jgi:hypothetical protein
MERGLSFAVYKPTPCVMKRVRSRLILGIFLFSAACTKATPDFEVLDEDRVPRPKFAGSYTKSLQTFSDSATYQINGECDPKVRSITGSAVGSVSASAWDINGITVSGINLTCSQDGKFSFELKSLASLGYAPTEGTVYEIQLKSETSGGTSKPSSIKILFTSGAGGTRPVLVTSGGTGAVLPSNGSLSSSVRVSHKINRASRIDQ